MADQAADPEIEKAQAVPAIFANRFYLTVSPDLVRITFGEAVVGTEATYRSAIIMRTSDAIELAKLINQFTATRTAQSSVQLEDVKSHATGQ